MRRSLIAAWRGPVLSILRAVAGFTFMAHGLQKTFGLLGGTRLPPASLAGVGGVLELIGGFLIMIGLLTRPTAFILSGEMCVAYFRFHAPGGLWPVQNRGELAILYCFLFFYLVFSGPGPLSLDAVLRRGGAASD